MLNLFQHLVKQGLRVGPAMTQKKRNDARGGIAGQARNDGKGPQ